MIGNCTEICRYVFSGFSEIHTIKNYSFTIELFEIPRILYAMNVDIFPNIILRFPEVDLWSPGALTPEFSSCDKITFVMYLVDFMDAGSQGIEG